MDFRASQSVTIPIQWVAVGGFRVALWPKLEQPGVDALCAAVSEAARDHAMKIGHPSRRQEWLAARVLSKELTGREPSAGPLGNPLWEGGWQGSISHKNGHVALWCAKRAATICGVDLELVRELSAGVTSKIMKDEEILICDDVLPVLGNSLIFAAKEAIYKALFPMVGRLFYFDAVALIDFSCAGNSCELVFSVLDALKAPQLTGVKIRVSAKKIRLEGGGRTVPENIGGRSDVIPTDYWLVVASLPVGCHS